MVPFNLFFEFSVKKTKQIHGDFVFSVNWLFVFNKLFTKFTAN